MAILGRDLAPRRTPRRRGRRLLAVAVVLAAAAAVYVVSTRGSGAPSATAQPPRCPAVSPPRAAPAAPGDVTVTVLNGTLRPRLARIVAGQLHRRGFRVRGVGNTPRRLARTTIRYPAADRAAARALAEQLGGVALTRGAAAAVELDLGRDFAGVLAPRQAAEARARDVAAAAPPPRRGCRSEPSGSR